MFVVSRFREERRAGRALEDAVAVAGATASRAVGEHIAEAAMRRCPVVYALFAAQITR